MLFHNILKRLLDIFGSAIGLIIFSPIIVLLLLVIFLTDFHSPFYKPIRVGKNQVDFKMLKLRTMVVNADKIGSWTSTSNDSRITPVGKFIRRIKIDEIVQLWNVFLGSMSLVGPRPQIKEVIEKTYTNKELELLNVKPGITDFSSIIFYDSNEILKNSADPYESYNNIIRPWKSRLGLFYIENRSFFLDLKLILITILSIFNRKASLNLVYKTLCKLNASSGLRELVLCNHTYLKPSLPPT